MQHALAPMCRAFGNNAQAEAVGDFGRILQAAAVKRFWDAGRQIFINNLPWLGADKEARTCDRSLATSILFEQWPEENTAAALKSLVECPVEMGFSYPANATWRYWALAKGGRAGSR